MTRSRAGEEDVLRLLHGRAVGGGEGTGRRRRHEDLALARRAGAGGGPLDLRDASGTAAAGA